MAQTATIYNLSIDLSDVDRGVYEQIEVRIARHPSETAEYMLVRVLAYCLEFQDGIFLTEGVASADEPAILIRDMTGQIVAAINISVVALFTTHAELHGPLKAEVLAAADAISRELGRKSEGPLSGDVANQQTE
jgi:hypothetical protein